MDLSLAEQLTFVRQTTAAAPTIEQLSVSIH
jgi:hypothetical protein